MLTVSVEMTQHLPLSSSTHRLPSPLVSLSLMMRRVLPVLLLLLVVGGLQQVKACPYQNKDDNAEGVLEMSPHKLPSMDATTHSAERGIRSSRNEESNQRRRERQGHRRRRLTVFNGFFPRMFLNFANLFDFWNLVPEPKPRNTQEAISSARKRIAEIIDDTGGIDAKFVRLAFHDCVGGICDGCVDLTNAENFGLQQPIDALRSVVRRNAPYLTTADVWALAGLVAAEETQQRSNLNFDLQFVQRPDCEGGNAAATTKGPDRKLPSAHLTTQGILDFFNTSFGFTARETVAIMGGHTLGVADSDNSGFNGPGGWGPGRNQLNNNYYTELLDNGRVNVDFALELQDNSNNPPFPNQFMWKLNGRRGGTFMFHADMALAIDMQGHLVDTTSGAINCTLVSGTATTCPPSPLLSIAVEYANNNNVWVNDFHDAFVKMVHSGCGNGVCQAV